MTEDLTNKILALLKKRKKLTTAEVVQRTNFSRAYVHRHFKELQDTGKIVRVGRANRAHYLLATGRAKERAKAEPHRFYRRYRVRALQEDVVWNQLMQQTGIAYNVRKNILRILEYSFTEMLNNAIDHSRSRDVHIQMHRTVSEIRFSIVDRGVGIFRHIKEQRHLRDEKEAIQDLLKGKQTTAPENHSGEGIFFTSRVADRLVFKSSGKRLIFDNRLGDVAIDKTSVKKGTVVDFVVSLQSRRSLTDVFKQFAGEEYEFSKTEVHIGLYNVGRSFVSRSQARRVLTGLDKFKQIILDFHNVGAVGQAFADEVFRVWKTNHPGTHIEVRGANENVEIMIAHVQSTLPEPPGKTTG